MELGSKYSGLGPRESPEYAEESFEKSNEQPGAFEAGTGRTPGAAIRVDAEARCAGLLAQDPPRLWGSGQFPLDNFLP